MSDTDPDAKLASVILDLHETGASTEITGDWSSIQNAIEHAFDKIKSSKYAEFDKTALHVESFSKLYRKLRNRANGDSIRLGDFLTGRGFPRFILECINMIGDSLLNDEPLLGVLCQLLSLAWNLSDSSVTLCKEMGSQESIRAFIGLAQRPEIVSEKEGQALKSLKAIFATLSNILRLNPDCKIAFRNEGGIELCLEHMESSVFNFETVFSLKMKAFLTLVFGADLEASTEVITATERNITHILTRLLDVALKSDSRRGNGYGIDEIFQMLTLLAKNTSNCVSIFNQGGLERVKQVMEQGIDEEIMESLHLVETMSFTPEVKQYLIKDTYWIPKLRELESHDNQVVTALVKGILWGLSEKDTKKSETFQRENSGHKRHVMISYNWAHQKQAMALKEELQKRGVSVWMDVEQMEGDMLERMAEAVEGASVIVTCLSEQYRDSANCRREASYALQLKKPVIPVMMVDGFQPRGWLGLLVGMNLYYKLHDQHFEQEFPKMFTAMKEFVADEDVVDGPATNILVALDSGSQPLFSKLDSEKFHEWLMGLGLSDRSMTVCRSLSCVHFRELKLLQSSEVQYFFEFCKNELQIESARDLLNFSHELRKLK